MRKILFALLFCAGSVLAGPATAQEWVRVESAEGKFTASFPQRPKYEAVPVGAKKDLTLHQWLFDTKDTAYLVSYIDYARGHAARNGADFVLGNMTKGLLTNRKLIKETKISQSGFPGRDAIVSTSDGFHLRQRHMLVGDRGYIWNYVGKPGTETGPDVQRFLDSLAIRR